MHPVLRAAFPASVQRLISCPIRLYLSWTKEACWCSFDTLENITTVIVRKGVQSERIAAWEMEKSTSEYYILERDILQGRGRCKQQYNNSVIVNRNTIHQLAAFLSSNSSATLQLSNWSQNFLFFSFYLFHYECLLHLSSPPML